MSARPILFSGPMVRAIFGRRKTQTRRVVKPQPRPATAHPDCAPWVGELTHRDFSIIWCTPKKDGGIYKDSDDHSPFRCPYGQPGDLLWVRETWQEFFAHEIPNHRYSQVGRTGTSDETMRVVYRADGEMPEHPEYGAANWRPSIHMPRWASRITLSITDVRVERVQEITGDQIENEGVGIKGWDTDDVLFDKWVELWDSINAARSYSWESNPWVWVVEFEAIKEEEATP